MPNPNFRPRPQRGWKSWFRSFFASPRATRGSPRRLHLQSLESRWVRSSFAVTDNSDSASDVNSLRYAITHLASGTSASTNTITIASVLTGGQTISLGSLLDINEGVTITGPGANAVTISGGNAVGVFKVESGVEASIAGLAITDGSASAGGAVDNEGTLSIADCTLSGNSATSGGGALYNGNGSLSIANCTISGNLAGTRGGGGVYDYRGSVSISNSTISGNSAAGNGSGGGVYEYAGSTSIANSTISGNSAIGLGGGVANQAGMLSITNNSAVEFNTATRGGAIANNSVMSIADSIVSGNSAAAGGGALYNETGSLSVANCAISGNLSGHQGGGGIYDYAGSVSITNSTISGNSAAGNGLGGGVFEYSGLTLIANSTISGNSASRLGGGIANEAGTVSITNGTLLDSNLAARGGGIANNSALSIANSTLSGNSAASDGGAFYNTYGLLSVASCTISGNSAVLGGALYNTYGSLSITNSTITGNSATHRGGALYNGYGSLSIANSTISGNSAGRNGGGIYNESALTLKNSIVSSNGAPTNADVTGGFTDSGNNLLGSALDTGSSPASDVFTDTPGLAALGNYGGLAATMPLLPGSSALGAGSVLGGGIPTTDQRGVNRPNTGQIDVGAYQSQGFTLTVAAGASPQSASVGTGFANALAVTVTANGLGGAVNGGVIAFTANPGVNGQSATLSGATVTISSGQASVTATANSQPGAYTVSASPGNTNSPVNFDLLNQVQFSVVVPVVAQPNLYHNNTSDAAISYVKSLYQAILDRSTGLLPNSQVPEYAPWVAVLNSLGGVTQAAARQAVATGIWNATEHRLDEVAAYYQTLLGRSTSGDTGAVFWVDQLQAGVGELSVVQQIMESAEYQNRTANNNTLFVQNLLGALGITGTTAVTVNGSLVNLLTALNGGTLTRSQVVSDAVLSDQSLQASVGSMYLAYLQRPAAANAGLLYWAGQMRTNGAQYVGIGLLSSQEYFQDIQANL